MSEALRRRKYRYDRVLIETDRILTPQFDDALVYLTGAQIEMLRNVTQYLNRLDTYVTEYNPGYYIAPTSEDYDDILEIVADLEETIMGNPNTIWGYKDRLIEYVSDPSAGAGTNHLAFDAVPEGEAWVVHGVWGKDDDSAIDAVTLTAYLDSVSIRLDAYDTPGAGESFHWNGHAVLAEGDYIRVSFYGCTVGDDIMARLRGYKMAVP